jgi:septum formation protein
MELILASKSPRRKAILEENGYEITIDPSMIDEDAREIADPGKRVMEIARRKAMAVAGRHRDSIVIAADTFVWFDGREIGQQKTEEEAYRTMRMLLGRTHKVYTGLCVINTSTGKLLQDSDCSEVTLKHVSEDVLQQYIASGKYRGKAGAYCITDPEFESFVGRVKGSWNNILGLPVEKARKMIDEASGKDVIEMNNKVRARGD